jgi:hypothetical protein
MGLRLKKQEKCRKQVFDIPVTKEEHQDQKDDFQEELDHLLKARSFLESSNSSIDELDALDKKISKLQSQIIEMKHMVPQEPDSILSETEIENLNSKYLPMLKKLMETSLAFLQGDGNAFKGTLA